MTYFVKYFVALVRVCGIVSDMTREVNLIIYDTQYSIRCMIAEFDLGRRSSWAVSFTGGATLGWMKHWMLPVLAGASIEWSQSSVEPVLGDVSFGMSKSWGMAVVGGTRQEPVMGGVTLSRNQSWVKLVLAGTSLEWSWSWVVSALGAVSCWLKWSIQKVNGLVETSWSERKRLCVYGYRGRGWGSESEGVKSHSCGGLVACVDVDEGRAMVSKWQGHWRYEWCEGGVGGGGRGKCDYLRLIATTCDNFRPLATTCAYLRQLETTCDYLRQFVAICDYVRLLRLLANMCDYLRLRKRVWLVDGPGGGGSMGGGSRVGKEQAEYKLGAINTHYSIHSFCSEVRSKRMKYAWPAVCTDSPRNEAPLALISLSRYLIGIALEVKEESIVLNEDRYLLKRWVCIVKLQSSLAYDHTDKVRIRRTAGEIVFAPRITLIPNYLPFEFMTLKFVHKSQRQILKFAGADLRQDYFHHIPFKVTCSRVSSPLSLQVVMVPPSEIALNTVYKEVLFNPRPGHSGFPHVGIVPDDAVGRWVFPALSFRRRSMPLSALKTSWFKSRPNLFSRSLLGDQTRQASSTHHTQCDRGHRFRSPEVSLPDFHTWASGWIPPLAGRFPLRSPVSPALAFRRCSSVASLHTHRLLIERPNKYKHFVDRCRNSLRDGWEVERVKGMKEIVAEMGYCVVVRRQQCSPIGLARAEHRPQPYITSLGRIGSPGEGSSWEPLRVKLSMEKQRKIPEKTRRPVLSFGVRKSGIDSTGNRMRFA
ncbi:hypothetical protein PR048_024018 [Dryococelus australis]|uniref:Uncharacterized protein n=1 Tax=Dryococelus australis TaxID=614101 RepID=A0ABQ9GVP9_9NEOP|nr:hypothetical protein PR048_024018 [Dryococelus australis]